MGTDQPVLWLMPVQLHFHHGHEIRVKVLSGLALQPVVAAPGGFPAARVLDRDGNARDLEPVMEGGESFFVFPAGDEGVYSLTAEVGGGTARVLLPVGHHVHGEGRAEGRGLELVPLHYRDFAPGDSIEMQVLLDGRPLGQAPVNAVSHLQSEHGYSHRLNADGHGVVRFTFREKGHWLFAAEGAGANGEKMFATLVVPGVR
ncbi:MAG: DUF4198 domain-containing protein [Eubacteriales bacterium]